MARNTGGISRIFGVLYGISLKLHCERDHLARSPVQTP
jgi:hypothetical protein